MSKVIVTISICRLVLLISLDQIAGSLAVGIVLVVLIPFLRKLITDKAETRPIEAATACRAVA